MNHVYVSFYNNIYVKEVNLLMESINGLIVQYKPTHLHILISSQGGAVESGFTAFNFLNALKGKTQIVTHNIGTIESIANLVFLAGDTRFCSPGASFAFHGVSWNFGQQINYRSQILDTHQFLGILETRLIDIVVGRTNIPRETVISWMTPSAHHINAEEALALGVVQDVLPIEVPQEAVHYVVPFTYIGQQ